MFHSMGIYRVDGVNPYTELDPVRFHGPNSWMSLVLVETEKFLTGLQLHFYYEFFTQG